MTLRETALSALQALVDARAQSDRIQTAMREAWPDFYGFYAVPAATEDAVVKLIDAALGDDNIASYLLYECWRGPGSVILPDQTEYIIASVEDVRAYLEATDREKTR